MMQALDSTIANVALPYMQGAVSATPDQVTWVLTAYIAVAAIVTPATGFLERRLGRRRLFLVAVAGFVLASMACGAAGSLGGIVTFRAFQGAFGAPLVPLSQAVLLVAYPLEARGRAMAIFGMGVMLGPIIGPALGGWLTDAYSWRWVFYVNLPIGVLALLGLSIFLRRQEMESPEPFDLFGFATLGLAVAALQVMLDRGQQLDWFASREIRVEAALAALGLYTFVVHTATAGPHPFLPPALFRDRNFVVGQILIFVVGAVLYGSLALLTPYLETLMGYPVLTAGLVTAPRSLGAMAAMVLVGRLSGLVDARLLILAGFAVTAYALHAMALFTPDVSERAIVVTGLVQGVGFGLVFPPLSTLTFATLRPELRTQGTGLFSLVRDLGSSIGISVATVLLARLTTGLHASLVEHITPYAKAVRSHRALLGLDAASGRAALDALVTQQANAIAYADDFRLMMWAALLAGGLVLLLARGVGPPPPGPRPLTEP
jgi:DHA2 family multidrug resistance protein